MLATYNDTKALVAAMFISTASLYPLQLWKTRVQVFSLLHKRRKKDYEDEEEGIIRDCFIEHFGWRLFCTGIYVDIMVCIPLSLLLLQFHNFWDKTQLYIEIGEEFSLVTEIYYGILMGIFASLIFTPVVNYRISLQINIPVQYYMAGLQLSILKEIIFWVSFVVPFYKLFTYK